MGITGQRFQRIAAASAVAGAAGLVLAGCTTDGGGGDDTPAATGTVTIAEVNELTSFNSGTPDGNVDINNQIEYFTQSDFFYLDTSASVVYDESFGTVEVLSEDPLSVKYTINEGITWSDGEPYDADDMVLSWAAQSGFYDEGEEIYFTPAGSTSGLDTTGYPEIGDDGRSITITYSAPYADWSLFTPSGVPAHVVAAQTGVEGSLLDVLVDGAATDQIRAVADFWNTGFDTASLPSDESLYLASGAFKVESWDPGQSVTLVKNESYTGDRAPEGIDTIVVRFIADANAQVTALENGEVDIINPQASGDILSQLESLDGVNVMTGDTGSYDHIDLNFNPAGVFGDPNVREAFLKTIPREQIVDAIIRPLDPEAGLLNSQIFFPGVTGYDEATAANGSDAYGAADIAGATELLGGATPTVRIAYNNENPNRVDAFLAIQASAAEAGITVEDGGLAADVWGAALTQPDTWDAFIFGWSTVGAGVTGVPQLFQTGSGSNFGGYSNPAADELMVELTQTVDPAEQVELQVQIEEHLWNDGFGLPMFILPGVIANNDRVQNVEYNTWQTGPIWNFWDWALTE